MKKLFDDDIETDSSPDFGSLFEQSMGGVGKTLKAGDRIRGEVISIGRDEIFVSTGTIHDGLVMNNDLPQEAGKILVKKGDMLDLFVLQVKGSDIRLSPKPTGKNMADDLADAYDMMLPVEGKVTELTNGGYRVAMMGKTAFCPFSQIDLRRSEDPDAHLEKKYSFLITQFSEGGRNIVVSRRKLLEEEQQHSQATFQDDVKVGDILKATVRRMEPFGAFVEISPGLEGLVHISEISWTRLKEPSEALQIGQPVQVKVLRMEETDGRFRISLSIKQAGDEPWATSSGDLSVGQTVQGRVTRLMKFGAFVELKPGIEGLLPLSEMSYTQRILKAEDAVKENELITVMIKEINADDRKMLLSLRDAAGDPWVMVPQNFPIGSVGTGKVTRREAYGIFVEMAPGVVGLLPKSKANENPDFPFENLKIGDPATVQVAEMDIENRKISLVPPKDPDADSWKSFQEVGGKPGGGGPVKSMGTLADQFKNAVEQGPQKKKK